MSPNKSGEQAPRKRIAIVTTLWKYLSHAQHMGDRFLVGYPWEGRWHRAPIDVVAVYADQKPAEDQSELRAKEFGFKAYPSIAEALRCGGDKLAVDAVVIIGEHGDYPVNEKGQIQYPRFEFFQECVKVFEADGRSVPIFNDKNLSYSFEKASKMVADSKRLGFPLLAGSSLPVTWRLPPVEVPLGARIEEALMVGVGGSDAMDYHALEAMQSMLERRKGGETGVRAVQLIEGPEVWKAGADGRWSRRLLEAALSRSTSRSGIGMADGRPQDWTHSGELETLVKEPAAYFIEYNDGLRATLLMLNGAVQDYNFACKLRGDDAGAATVAGPTIISTQFLLPVLPNVAYSSCLVHGIEEMITSGVAPYPVERTQITCGILDRCLDSKVNGHNRLPTPELKVIYQPPEIARYCGAAT
jgi:hypothetical protein